MIDTTINYQKGQDPEYFLRDSVQPEVPISRCLWGSNFTDARENGFDCFPSSAIVEDPNSGNLMQCVRATFGASDPFQFKLSDSEKLLIISGYAKHTMLLIPLNGHMNDAETVRRALIDHSAQAARVGKKQNGYLFLSVKVTQPLRTSEAGIFFIKFIDSQYDLYLRFEEAPGIVSYEFNGPPSWSFRMDLKEHVDFKAQWSKENPGYTLSQVQASVFSLINVSITILGVLFPMYIRIPEVRTFILGLSLSTSCLGSKPKRLSYEKLDDIIGQYDNSKKMGKKQQNPVAQQNVGFVQPMQPNFMQNSVQMQQMPQQVPVQMLQQPQMVPANPVFQQHMQGFVQRPPENGQPFPKK